ncbi:apolipoprotein M isoform X2 [Scleropages formosus]|uniref:apolipoprotein M isoform X2 n=1 Tax=Scleropages formosus TaxID=113540 RepID=UPI000878F4B3|nr:apolipoprotein M isoform X2 [Scleropages formosus]XP_018596240.1 apolipoprotein M isoform X2 [Scleropages formosus]XP_018596241.1 apolipoprotein M isoform X2 [Scleropages formosus]XP_018596242.1 apolipoprotein M isoform X2 [Scleropages formosus]XP_018596243.1 apolipoprotein M isoform X2 [Scleropages formosus]XP_018596244.1 apolipoprotein M isoform X2 [Scleropages formosus]
MGQWSLWPCSLPEILSTSSVNTKQYLGSWYFIAAVGVRESDVAMYKSMDNTVALLQEAIDANTLLLMGAIRVEDYCLKKNWTYHIRQGRKDLELEGRPERHSWVWSGQWLNCTDCILFQELEPELEGNTPLNRVLLYARNTSVSTELVRDFQAKTSCLGMKNFLIMPQEREYCQLDGAA